MGMMMVMMMIVMIMMIVMMVITGDFTVVVMAQMNNT